MKRLFIIILLLFALSGNVYAAIDPPTGLAVSTKTNTSITLVWTNASENYDSLMVYLSDATWLAQVSGSTETYQNTGLTPGTSYSYYVKADSAGTTANSDTLTVSTYYPPNDGVRYSSAVEADITGYMADSWGSTQTSSVTLAGESAIDSTVVIIPFDYTTFQCNAAGDSANVMVYFYGGKCNGPFYVTKQDSLLITSAGVHRKDVYWGPDSHGYAVFVAQVNNGSDNTILSNIYWTFRRPGEAR